MTALPLARELRPRAAYADLAPYAPDRAFAPIDLSDNTNRWGMSPAAARALREVSAECVTRYPEVYVPSLQAALAEYLGVDARCIATGCGSDDVLDSAIRAFGEPGDRLALPDPSFVMLASFARMNGLVPVMIPLTESYDVDVDATRVGGARIVYICSPNNPTGTVIDRAAIEHIARDTDGLVIVDEAYAEFAGDSAVALTSSHPNLLVVRTMSKAFGLAGLRVGYAIGAPSLIAEIEKSRGPYKVNALGAAAAIAALREGMAWVRTHVALAVENRERLTDSLRARQLAVVPSLANFVLVPLANAAAIASAMRAAGVAVRPFTRVRQVSPELRRSGGDALRISVGPWDQLQRALDALDEARRTCA